MAQKLSWVAGVKGMFVFYYLWHIYFTKISPVLNVIFFEKKFFPPTVNSMAILCIKTKIIDIKVKF